MIPGRGREGIFCLCHFVQTGCGAHPPFYSRDAGVFLWE